MVFCKKLKNYSKERTLVYFDEGSFLFGVDDLDAHASSLRSTRADRSRSSSLLASAMMVAVAPLSSSPLSNLK